MRALKVPVQGRNQVTSKGHSNCTLSKHCQSVLTAPPGLGEMVNGRVVGTHHRMHQHAALNRVADVVCQSSLGTAHWPSHLLLSWAGATPLFCPRASLLSSNSCAQSQMRVQDHLCSTQNLSKHQGLLASRSSGPFFLNTPWDCSQQGHPTKVKCLPATPLHQPGQGQNHHPPGSLPVCPSTARPAWLPGCSPWSQRAQAHRDSGSPSVLLPMYGVPSLSVSVTFKLSLRAPIQSHGFASYPSAKDPSACVLSKSLPAWGMKTRNS